MDPGRLPPGISDPLAASGESESGLGLGTQPAHDRQLNRLGSDLIRLHGMVTIVMRSLCEIREPDSSSEH